MYTVDASVWVNGFDQRESGHEISRQFLELLRVRQIPLIEPVLMLIEVAGAISRTRQDPGRAEAFASTLGQLPNLTIMPLDNLLGQRALALATHHGLRGADAVYAAVAQQADCTLVSLDNEHLIRLAGLIKVQPPRSHSPS